MLIASIPVTDFKYGLTNELPLHLANSRVTQKIRSNGIWENLDALCCWSGNISIFRTTVAGSIADRPTAQRTALTYRQSLPPYSPPAQKSSYRVPPPVPTPKPSTSASCDDNRSMISQTTRESAQPARSKRNNRRKRCKIMAAFCITFWLIAVANAIAAAFLVQNAVKVKGGDDTSPINGTLANSTVAPVKGWITVSEWQKTNSL